MRGLIRPVHAERDGGKMLAPKEMDHWLMKSKFDARPGPRDWTGRRRPRKAPGVPPSAAVRLRLSAFRAGLPNLYRPRVAR